MPMKHNTGALSTRSQRPGSGPEYPIVIAQWDRNAREVIRVALDQYNGHDTVNVRVWYRDGETLKPGKTGITVGVKHLAALAEASGKALERARELGLVDDGGEQ